MTLSELSIRRPVLAAVFSLLIIVFGIAGLAQIPIRELPDIDAAVVAVTTTYTGAAPEIVDSDITELIDGAVAGISGVKTITSQSSRGRSVTTIEFELGRDIDEAANDVRDAVGRVRGRLPDEVDEPQVIKNDSDSDPVMRLAVTSSRMDPAEVTDYIDRFIKDRITTIEGVATVDIYGERRGAIRVWLDRRAMAARNLTVADVSTALTRNNIELPGGEIESQTRLFTVRLNSRLNNVQQFRDIVLRQEAGYPIRLSAVARVDLGVEDDSTIVRNNGDPAIGIAVIRQSQANTIAISNAVRAELDRLKDVLPDGMAISVGSDDAIFVAASIREVLIALSLSLVLVVLVILVFLRSIRTTLIPAITIPVSLIGCFFLIYVLGFSLNVLTLLALLLAIGLVVDDAIVMLENIERRLALGESKLQAAVYGARQVTFAILATSVTLIAVFVPISFLKGAAGRLFTEFGLVMASAVLISTFVALSACPALASIILKARAKRPAGDGITAPEKPAENRLSRWYRAALSTSLKVPLLVIFLSLVFSGASWFVFQSLPSELSPSEDRGVLFIPLTAPQGSNLAFTDSEAKKLEADIVPVKDELGINTIFTFTGSRGRAYRSFVVLRLEPWSERELGHREIMRELAPFAGQLTGARGFPVSPSGLGLRGNSTPLRAVIGGPDFESVKGWAQALLEKAETNEGLRNVEIDFEQNQPQFNLIVDRAKADDLGISIETIASTLQAMFASLEATTYIDRGREYPVMLQADAEDRQTPNDISSIFIRAGDGVTLVPLSALVTIGETAEAPALRRYNRLPSITLEAALNDGYALGTAIGYIREIAAETLPAEASLNFAGQSQQYLETSSGVAITFALAILIVFLVLAGQFESFIHPLIIMLSVPLAVAGAVYSLWFGGLSLNIYSQIGIILLIGLMAKNGILIVEFANQLRDEGYDVREAVIEASVIRFRPILMTTVSTVLGAVPLVLAFGAGAESRQAIGTVIIGGLLFAGLLTLFLTPVLYDLLARYTKPRGHVEKRLAQELARPGASQADLPGY
ncbi:efflux RND transporter permease subunit [Oceanibacterium hippocampi]|uniref:Efflux pump membrane transporter BepE n=1 Tax=Oceanibacterium hippocampi TaxID=745714 RepID=A0A1Y5TUF2_9PROT|nr:efflux RND transporter permease subunit [Oceanibacterium hippocampi]SLN70417.1 Efflux pump membrane transporter BepE [Oceanibacterium hippocampi]